MNSWLVWGGFAIAVVFLGWVAYHFTVRTLRFVTLAFVVAGVVLVTRYGVTHPSPAASAAPVDLVNAFTRGLDDLSGAFFQPLLPGPDTPLPGRVGWLVIVVFLAFAYRELEVWAMRWQPPTVDTSALGGDQPGTQNSDGQANRATAGQTGSATMTDSSPNSDSGCLRWKCERRRSCLAARRRMGSHPSPRTAVWQGSGLAGAIIRVVGMLWPNPRRYQVRVWVKPADQPAAANSERNGQDNPPHRATTAVARNKPWLACE